QAPRAVVPVSLRERGDTSQRGRASPVRDRSRERELLRRRREQERLAAEQVADEVYAWAASVEAGEPRELSMPAFAALRDLLGRASASGPPGDGPRMAAGLADLCCELHRKPGRRTVVECPEGRLVLNDL